MFKSPEKRPRGEMVEDQAFSPKEERRALLDEIQGNNSRIKEIVDLLNDPNTDISELPSLKAQKDSLILSNRGLREKRASLKSAVSE